MLVRRILPLLLIVLMLGALFVAAFAAASALPVQDLAQYWAAAHLVTKNPYSLELTTNFERSAGVFSSGRLRSSQRFRLQQLCWCGRWAS